MHDPNYYDEILLNGAARPNSAYILSEQERTIYRKEMFGIDA
ncbi:hypothetical protein SAMN02745129_4515 [Ferrimonas marina]|uniref:Uncharacterized protein n=2 Tax=Ferrimonas marina TaxID=299255 RepID=A0A1M5YV79_9GAMM|nr:hypothetical protein SAMN02745129_4515 [Ferrimonas marina]